MERIKHGNVLMTIDDENKQEALNWRNASQILDMESMQQGYDRLI